MSLSQHLFEGAPDQRQTPPAEPPPGVSRFRKRYRALTPEEIALHDMIKEKAEELERLFEKTPTSRAQSIAMTHLEAAVMWGVKGLTSS